MALSQDIINKFVNATNDSDLKPVSTKVYGTIVSDENSKYVKIDGTETLTPIVEGVAVFDGDRVLVDISNHVATVETNLGHPASDTVKSLSDKENVLKIIKNAAFMPILQSNIQYIGDLDGYYIVLEKNKISFNYEDRTHAIITEDGIVFSAWGWSANIPSSEPSNNPIENGDDIVEEELPPEEQLNVVTTGDYAFTKFGSLMKQIVSGEYDEGLKSNDSYPFNDKKTIHLFGENLVANSDNETAVGISNVKDRDYAFVVGNGTKNTAFQQEPENFERDWTRIPAGGTPWQWLGISRSNAFSVDWDGNVYAKGNMYVNCDANGDNGTKVPGGFRIIEKTITTGSISSNGYSSKTLDFGDTVDRILAVSYIRSTDSDVVPYRWDFEGTTVNIGVKNTNNSSQSATIHIGVLTTT